MPDISLCSGNNCNLKENCYRYLATPKPFWQSYFGNPPLEEDGSCKYFWNNSYEQSCNLEYKDKDEDA